MNFLEKQKPWVASANSRVSQPEAHADWRSSPFPAPSEAILATSLCDNLLDVAEKFPRQTALVDRGRSVSFQALALRIGAMAKQIREAKAAQGPIALLISANVDAVAAWFACAAAGRPLLMLELRNPPDRNRALMTAAGATLLLHDGNPAALAVRDACMALRPSEDGGRTVLARGMGLGVDDPAMIFPTSGSTGEPKLIAYSQRTMQAKAQASILTMRAAPGDVVLIAGSHANYGFMHHALVFLLSGGCLCLTDILGDGLAGVFAAILEHNVRNVRFTPSMFRAAVANPASREALRQLKAVRFSGEPLLISDLELARAHLSPDCLIQNVYGSTESALFVWSSDHDVIRADELSPIGRIYPLAEFEIRHEDNDPASFREIGELVISSRYQALGDWREGRVDGARFPADPRGGGRRLYFTGDMVRPAADGGLVMLGRKDRLVKVNGQRVSLMELEAHLRALPNCAQAAVFERRGASGSLLAAFLKPTDPNAPRADARAWLSARVPPYMVPARFEWVDEMPLLPGGKIDSARLLARLPAQLPPQDFERSGDLSADLRAMWRSLLEMSDCGLDDDFFILGGDSLKFMQLTLGVEQRFGVKLNQQAFLKLPTLRRLAQLIDPVSIVIHGKQWTPRIEFQLHRAADGKSNGVALGMPGMLGRAEVLPGLVKAGALRNFDIWSCNAPWDDGGDILTDQRWLSVTKAIVERLQKDDQLQPALLFGFSAAGFMAWLAARMLATSRDRPKRILCFDAPAMHRRAKYQSAELRDIIASSAVDRPRMLHIRRPRPGGIGWRDSPHPDWSLEDAVISSIAMRTIEHEDFRANVIGPVVGAIDRFAEEDFPTPEHAWSTGFVAVDTDGGRLFEMLRAPGPPDRNLIAAMTRRRPGPNSWFNMAALMFFAVAVCDLDTASTFVERLAEAYPDNPLFAYALRQLRGCSLPRKQIDGSDNSKILPDVEAWPLSAAHPLDLFSLDAIDRALAARGLFAPN